MGAAGRYFQGRERPRGSEGRRAPITRSKPAQSLGPWHEPASRKDGHGRNGEVQGWQLRCGWGSM